MPSHPLSLDVAGAVVQQPITAPAPRRYQLSARFEFSSVEARLGDRLLGQYSSDCLLAPDQVPPERRAALGRPIPFRVTVRRQADAALVLEKTFTSVCVHSHVDATKSRDIGMIDLQPGKYVLEVINLEAQPGFEQVRTTVMLQG